MSFGTFMSEAAREKWIVPFEHDLIGKEFDYDLVWVYDLVPDEFYTDEDRKYDVKLAYAFDKKLQKKIILNANFIEKCVILKKDT